MNALLGQEKEDTFELDDIRGMLPNTVYIFFGITVGGTSSFLAYVVSNNFWLSIIVGIVVIVALIVLNEINVRAEHKQYLKEETAYELKANKLGFSIKDDTVYRKKLDMRDYLVSNPETTYAEFFSKFGDENVEIFNTENFQQTAELLGFYSINRFGQDENGNWSGIHAKKTIKNRYNRYRKETLKSVA